MIVNFEKFLDEFYLSQKNGTLSDYTIKYWDDVLHLFGDSPVIFDILIEQIINGKESQFNDSKNNLIEIYNTTKDFSQYVFNETNPEFEELKKENESLRQELAMTQAAFMEVTDYVFSK
ncbi:hypothetical protein [Enterococcus gallinarum]|uniref:hypothetical protein n=1 Tax=Enterococcus gallinarum TaxID=1353 RepID=UPI0013C22DC5|nr:hypothetical protein [Enterococcus gallinarum]MUO32469.1 hypothetical protein [Enterococcus gallinarum]